MKNLLAPISTICVCSIFIGFSRQSFIFYPEILPQDYQFVFSEPFEEVTVPVEIEPYGYYTSSLLYCITARHYSCFIKISLTDNKC